MIFKLSCLCYICHSILNHGTEEARSMVTPSKNTAVLLSYGSLFTKLVFFTVHYVRHALKQPMTNAIVFIESIFPVELLNGNA